MKKILYFSAAWCGPCRSFGPVMEQVASTGIPVEKIDVDSNPDKTHLYNIKNIPTCIVVDQNGVELTKHIGVQSREFMINLFNEA